MTSCVFSLLLFISLFSSIGAQGPVGVKVRVTNQALDMLKNQALAILQEQLVNQPFNDLKCGGGVMKCAIKRLTISKLTVDQADLQFQERTGFMLEIRKFSLFLSYERQLAPCLGDTGSSIFAVGGLSVSIGMSLQRNKQGHLRVEMPNCQVNAENMALISTGKLKDLWNSLQGCLRGLFNTLFCPLVKMIGLAAANKKLDAMMENREILKQYAINIDYSVTRDVQVTSTNLDVCFKGMVYRKGENPATLNAGVEPVFTKNNQMAYVGVSEFFFNSVGMSLYRSGPFPIPELNWWQNFIRKAVGVPEAPFNVELTEAATAKITRDGLIVTVKANARSQKEPTKPPFPLNCQVDLKIGVKDKSLVSLSHNVKCNSDTVKGNLCGLGNIIISFLNWYYGGILMPLPEGLDFSQGEIEYYDGYLVIGGDLSMTQAAREKMMRRTGS